MNSIMGHPLYRYVTSDNSLYVSPNVRVVKMEVTILTTQDCYEKHMT